MAEISPTEVQSIPALAHDEAMSLQAAELERSLAVLKSIAGEAWTAPTACPGWDVRAMYLHVLGACEAGASLRENIHQLHRARRHRKRHGGPLEAALSFVQVADRSNLLPGTLVVRLTAAAPKTIRARNRIPKVVRTHLRLKVEGEAWTLGYLNDTIYLRDLWMHRLDLHDALGTSPTLTPAHDGRIVADIVAEWAQRHRQPFTLELAGTVGGMFTYTPTTADTEPLHADTIEFCRILAGRGHGTGLLATPVPF